MIKWEEYGEHYRYGDYCLAAGFTSWILRKNNGKPICSEWEIVQPTISETFTEVYDSINLKYSPSYLTALERIKERAETYILLQMKPTEESPVTLEHHSKVMGTKAWEQIPFCIVELQEEGNWFTQNYLPYYEDPCILARYKGLFAGFMIYREDSGRSSWHINLAYVVPKFRRMGIHTKMFEALVSRAKEKNILIIESGTSVNNKSTQAAFEKQGRELIAFHYEYRIAEFQEPREDKEKAD